MAGKYEKHPMEKNFQEWDKIQTIQQTAEHSRARDFAPDLLRVAKMAYRKHACNDDSIGWEELQSALCDTLCNVMGDDEFNKIFGEDS